MDFRGNKRRQQSASVYCRMNAVGSRLRRAVDIENAFQLRCVNQVNPIITAPVRISDCPRDLRCVPTERGHYAEDAGFRTCFAD